MLRNACLLLVVGLLAGAAPLRVEDAYTIKVKKSRKGDVVTQDEQNTDQSKFKIEGPDGKMLREKEDKKTTTLTYKETILEKEEGKKPTRLRREYTKAVVKTGNEETTLPYQGKTVLIEKKEGKYHFAIEGGKELTGKDAELLDKSFNKDGADDSDTDEMEKALFPKNPVRVNETWAMDSQSLLKAFEKGAKAPFPVDKTKVAGKGKLLRAYKKDDKQYGVLEFTIDMPLKGNFPFGKDKAPIQPGSKMTMHINVDACIDGTSSDAKGDMSMDIDITALIKGGDGKDYKMLLNIRHKEKKNEKDQTSMQKSGVRSQKSEVRGQESEVRSQESGVRSQKSGVRSQKSGVRRKDNLVFILTSDF